MIDSTVIRIDHHAVAVKGALKVALCRSRGGFSTEIHHRSDGAARAMRIDVTPGEGADSAGY